MLPLSSAEGVIQCVGSKSRIWGFLFNSRSLEKKNTLRLLARCRKLEEMFLVEDESDIGDLELNKELQTIVIFLPGKMKLISLLEILPIYC